MSLALCLPPVAAGDALRSRISTHMLAPPVLDRVPVEVLVEVFKHLDLESAFNLRATNRALAAIFATNRMSIILPILQVEFSPLDGLLQVVKATPDDLYKPCGTWLDKRIRWRNTYLCEGGFVPSNAVPSTIGVTGMGGISCQEAVLEEEDLDEVLSVCRVVKGWERVFPQHRFVAKPLATRSLRRSENERLRRALYTWMRYAYYFHEELPRPSHDVPAGRDVRVNQLRILSNDELRGLRDLWLTVEDIVTKSLCPSIDLIRNRADYELSDREAAHLGWGGRAENERVVPTMCKLSPADMLYYLDNRHLYTKGQLISEIRQRHTNFEFDTESLSSALWCVGMERYIRAFQETSTPDPCLATTPLYPPLYDRLPNQGHGGILDLGDLQHKVDHAQFEARYGDMAGWGLDWRPENRAYFLQGNTRESERVMRPLQVDQGMLARIGSAMWEMEHENEPW